ncbi:hypothetical protein [Streptomyces sp. NPDC093970]|uniref:hypothetical protein n=1 Tax=Streptomyces sp. NPDC093970 TaxID=3155076 RepID=UPI00341F0AB4
MSNAEHPWSTRADSVRTEPRPPHGETPAPADAPLSKPGPDPDPLPSDGRPDGYEPL